MTGEGSSVHANQVDYIIDHYYEDPTEDEDLAVQSIIHRGLNPNINKKMPFVNSVFKKLNDKVKQKDATFVLPPPISNYGEEPKEKDDKIEESTEEMSEEFKQFKFDKRTKKATFQTKDPLSDL